MKRAYLLTCFIFLLMSCKKEKDGTNSRLLGKWVFEKWTSHEVSSSGAQETYTGFYGAGDYIEFKSDGSCVLWFGTSVNNTSWQVLDNGKLLIADNGNLDLPEEGYEIQSLTGSSLILYAREMDPWGGYYEITINLHR